MQRHCLLFVCIVLLLGTSSGSHAEQRLRDTIDGHVSQAWKENKVTPSEPSSDTEFLRRVYLDLLGQIPSYDDALAFLNDASSDKRERLIDQLLDRPRYGIHQSDVWDMVYFGRNPPGYGTDKRQGFQNWLADQFANNIPYDVWVKKILRAEGNTVEDGAPMFFVQYKSRPEDATEAITQKFLGVQLQCARCHDHPFDSWLQRDFYGMASFFSRLQVVDVGTKNKEKAYAIGEMNTGDVLFTGPVTEQTPGKKGEPVKPKFLGADALVEPELPKDVKDPRNFPAGKVPPKPHFSRKDALADWITRPNNPYFARAAANRVWAQFMGRGIVHPIDNLSKDNPPSHPELLDELTKEFVTHKFDLKWLVREILNSNTYQLSASGPLGDAKPRWFERANFRPLSAEELFDSWMVASGYDEVLKASNQQPTERFKVRGITWDYMRRFFGRPNDGVGDFQGGLHEHLYLNNGQVHSLISTQKGSLYDAIVNSKDPWEARVERMFIQTLSRRSTPEETEQFVAHVTAKDDPQGRLREAIWTLMTCSEFRFNH